MKHKPMPLEMADVINAYQATGRVVFVYPFAGRISLNGGPRVSYAEALNRMKQVVQLPPDEQ